MELLQTLLCQFDLHYHKVLVYDQLVELYDVIMVQVFKNFGLSLEHLHMVYIIYVFRVFYYYFQG